MIRPAIVVMAYNRSNPLKRLLNSLCTAEYNGNVDLVISLEGNATEDVRYIAEKFECNGLNKIIVYNEKNLGLRNHVIKCGDLVDKYDAVILLEDDLVVDKYFYIYAMSALAYYSKSDKIAGIALYSYERNEFAGYPFKPMSNGFSTFLMQVPCSWGQCWSKKQWQEFRQWYGEKNSEHIEKNLKLPKAVRLWPESSWKKYFHGYIAEENKYFVYPYQTYTTNCSDEGGTHIKKNVHYYNVSLPNPKRRKPDLEFVNPDDNEVLYDSYMEPSGDFVYRELGITNKEIQINLYGIKDMSYLERYEYVLISGSDDNALKKYPLSYKPIEYNLLYPCDVGMNGGLSVISVNDYKSYYCQKRNRFLNMDLIDYFSVLDLRSPKFFVSYFIYILRGIFMKAFK